MSIAEYVTTRIKLEQPHSVLMTLDGFDEAAYFTLCPYCVQLLDRPANIHTHIQARDRSRKGSRPTIGYVCCDW